MPTTPRHAPLRAVRLYMAAQMQDAATSSSTLSAAACKRRATKSHELELTHGTQADFAVSHAL